MDKIIKRTRKIRQSISKIDLMLENSVVANSNQVLEKIREDLDRCFQMMNQVADHLGANDWEGSEASEAINDNPESDGTVTKIIEISD